MLLASPLRKAPLAFQADSVCLRCLRKLSRPSSPKGKFLSTSGRRNQDAFAFAPGLISRASSRTLPSRSGLSSSKSEYFWANGVLQGFFSGSGSGHWRTETRKQSTVVLDERSKTKTSEEGVPLQQSASKNTNVLPHRRRRKEKDTEESNDTQQLPLDASNRLTTLSSALPANSIRRLLTTYLSLSKPRLSFLIVLTTTAAYSIYPVPALLSATATTTPSLSTLTLLFLTTGTFLTCASANALNMLFEPEHDAKMSRTRNRPLVRGLISKRGALLFAIFTGITGTAALYAGVNPTTAFLAAVNIGLYAGVYTPLKRISVINTWAGAVVGAIPPLMGWTAAAGQCATGNGEWRELLFSQDAIGGWLLAGLLFCWQFPHFNALSWPIREEYKHAGYRMLCWVNPGMNGRVALRYSILMFPICIGLAYAGTVEWAFVPISSAANGWVLYQAVRFWKYEGKKGTARALFWASVWHLPLVLVVGMLLKKGLWERVWRAAMGQSEEDEFWDEDEEVEDVPRTAIQAGAKVALAS